MRKLAVIFLAMGCLPAWAQSAHDLATALQQARSGQYLPASERLFNLSYSPRFASRRMQIKYILGLTLQQMKLNQVAAFQYVGVIKDGTSQYVKPSLERLSVAADGLGDETLLNYAISRIHVQDFPRSYRGMLFYRIGEYEFRKRDFLAAARSFGHVQPGHSLYPQAKYEEGLALAEANRTTQALAAFNQLMQSRAGQPENDKDRVAGLMGKARVLYQMKKWDEAIEAYREVPRDSQFWHDTLSESSWAMLRSGRFRSALSNFQSLHSAFYEGTYLPESLLLRAIVYLYICKYDEMDKVLNLFSTTYKPVYRKVENTLKTTRDDGRYFAMMNTMVRMRDKNVDPESKEAKSGPLPYLVASEISRAPDFQHSYQYLHKLVNERRQFLSLPASWRHSPVGRYAARILTVRFTKAKMKTGRIVHNHLEGIRNDLVDYIEQEGFIRYEMINGHREAIRKKIAGKDLPDTHIDQDTARDYYIQNGYEYWPFQGEYWLDELGNYHYVGTQSCN